MRHHEVLITFSFGAFRRSIVRVRGNLSGVSKRRLAWLRRVPERLSVDVDASSVRERASQP